MMKKLLVLAVVLGLVSSSFGATYWTGATSNDLKDATNWTAGLTVDAGIKNIGQSLVEPVMSSGTADFYRHLDTGYIGYEGSLLVTGGTINLVGSGGRFQAGYKAKGVITMSGGVVNCNSGSGLLAVGAGDATGDGTLNLSGGTINVGTGGIRIGNYTNAVQGTLNMSGGLIDGPGSDLRLGYNSGVNSYLNMSSGTINARGLIFRSFYDPANTADTIADLSNDALIHTFNSYVDELTRDAYKAHLAASIAADMLIAYGGTGTVNVSYTENYNPTSMLYELTTDITAVIPEPMTIALLGLGGLFIRRRK